MNVNIAGLNKVQLLREMWVYAGIGLGGLAAKFDEAQAEQAVKGYIDYFCGRAIKCNLSGDTVNPGLYDRDAGINSLARIVYSMRSK